MKHFLIMASFILISSCNGQKKAALEDDTIENSQSDDRLELVVQEAHSSFDVSEMLVIRDVKRLKSFYSKVNRTRKPGLPVPEVDFANKMVIIQCVGSQNDSEIQLLSFVKETDTQVVLSSKLEKNASNTSAEVMTNPFYVYKMPLTQKEVIFEKR